MHACGLVIGATGMLAEATISLSARCDLLTFTAQSSQSISRMSKVLEHTNARCIGLTLDWNEETKFLARLAAHCDEYGYPSLIVAWLHDDRLGAKIATFFAMHGERTKFYQIRGSAAAKPGTGTAVIADQHLSYKNQDYHEIILGFELEPSGSRWLSNSEISAGVISAIDSGDSVSVVGVVDPWASRP